jgi:mRNA interferase HicA
MKRRDFVRHLTQQGCVLVREGRNHTIFENLANNRRSPVPRHSELPEPLAHV